jgi:hypothetical protein
MAGEHEPDDVVDLADGVIRVEPGPDLLRARRDSNP